MSQPASAEAPAHQRGAKSLRGGDASRTHCNRNVWYPACREPTLAATRSARADSLEPTLSSELFAVDGQRRLNMFCMGDGTPAIVFVSGAWENTMAWRRVQAPASRLARACSYDRAGLGFSDPAAHSSTARNAVDDLTNLLDAASVEMPVVLVGHSAGGLYALLFTALYPDRVAGVVLVDPSDPEANNNFGLAGHHPPDLWKERGDRRRQITSGCGTASTWLGTEL